MNYTYGYDIASDITVRAKLDGLHLIVEMKKDGRCK